MHCTNMKLVIIKHNSQNFFCFVSEVDIHISRIVIM